MGLMIAYQILRGVDVFLTIVSYAIFAYVLLSWFVSPMNRFYRLLGRMCEPILEPFRGVTRRLMARGFMMDVSPILAYIAIRIVKSLMWWLFGLIF